MRSCDRCGSVLSRSYVRVFGDNDDGVNGCLYCLETLQQPAQLHTRSH
ncbi:DUF7563 family protein [Natronolimnohabitans innermongolicus]